MNGDVFILGVSNGIIILSLGVALAYLAMVSGNTPVGCGVKIFQDINILFLCVYHFQDSVWEQM